MAASVRANALLCWAFSNSRSIPVIRLAHCTRWLDAFVAGRLLIAGYVVLLTGLFWVNDTSSYTKLYYALLAAPTLIVMLAKPQYWRMLIREPIVMAFLVMAAWLLLSLSWTQTEDDPSSLAKRPLYVFMMFAACAIIALKDQQRLLKALRIAAMLASAAAMVGLAIFLSRNDGGRMIGTGALSNPLLSSHVYGFFCAYWMAVWLTDRDGPSWLPIMFAAPLIAALLATGSRTPLMALGMVSIWMAALGGRRALYLVAAMAFIVISGFLLRPDVLLQRGLSFRPELWGEAIRQASEHLWVGHGYGAEFTFTIAGLGRTLSDPHNVELAVLLELGIVGLTLWLVMYAIALVRCLNKQACLQLASALAVYGLAAGLTEGSNFLSRPNENWFLIWIPLSFIAALSISLRQKGPLLNALTEEQFNHLLQGADVIEADGHGVKVAKLADGRYLKLFRRKRFFSTALWAPPSRRFASNAQHLLLLGVPAPAVSKLIQIKTSKVDGVLYLPLPGDTLRNRWRALTDAERELEIEAFGAFLGHLHQLGIYFRSLHLGNVIKLPDGSFGLIDVSDMSISNEPLKPWKRRRNLTHMLRYGEDSNWLAVQHISSLTEGYAEHCGQRAALKLNQQLNRLVHATQ